MRVVFFLIMASFLAPFAASGTAEKPEVMDSVGDVTTFGAPVPLGLEWADIQSAWFTREGEDLHLWIRVGGGQSAPETGEVGVTFRVGDKHFISGYTVVPGIYSGGFLSESDEHGDVPPGAKPVAKNATFEDGLIHTVFAIAEVQTIGDETALFDPWGWSESRATQGERYRLDRTDVGAMYTWAEAREVDAGPRQDASGASFAAGTVALLVALLKRRD